MITSEFSLRFQSVWPLSAFLPKNLTVFPIRFSCKLDKPPMGMTLIVLALFLPFFKCSNHRKIGYYHQSTNLRCPNPCKVNTATNTLPSVLRYVHKSIHVLPSHSLNDRETWIGSCFHEHIWGMTSKPLPHFIQKNRRIMFIKQGRLVFIHLIWPHRYFWPVRGSPWDYFRNHYLQISKLPNKLTRKTLIKGNMKGVCSALSCLATKP